MRFTVLTVIALVGALSVGVSAAPVFTTTFSEYNLGAGSAGYAQVASGTYGQITVGGGGVDWVGTCWQPAAPGSQSIDLNRNLNESGWIQINLENALTAGNQYELVFAMAGNPDVRLFQNLYPGATTVMNMGVSIGSHSGTYTFDVANGLGAGIASTRENMGWVYYTLTFTADGTEDSFIFASLMPDGTTMWGPVVGGIQLNDLGGDDPRPGPDPTHAPEPATLLMMGVGLAGVALVRRRYNR